MLIYKENGNSLQGPELLAKAIEYLSDTRTYEDSFKMAEDVMQFFGYEEWVLDNNLSGRNLFGKNRGNYNFRNHFSELEDFNLVIFCPELETVPTFVKVKYKKLPNGKLRKKMILTLNRTNWRLNYWRLNYKAIKKYAQAQLEKESQEEQVPVDEPIDEIEELYRNIDEEQWTKALTA